MKKVFIILAVIGVIIISILSFTIPENPYEIIPSITILGFDKPLWLCIMVGGSFAYLLFLYCLYDFLDTKIFKWFKDGILVYKFKEV